MQMMERATQLFPDGPLWYTKVVLLTDRWLNSLNKQHWPSIPKAFNQSTVTRSTRHPSRDVNLHLSHQNIGVDIAQSVVAVC